MEKTCPRCAIGDFGRSPREDGVKHVATVPQPSVESMMEQEFRDGTCETTGGCVVEPDGHCEHGHTAWMRVIGII